MMSENNNSNLARVGAGAPRIGPQTSVPLDEESSDSQGEEGFRCEVCGRVFASKIGLGVHKIRAHPIAANEAIDVNRVKARWSTEEVVLLAKEEVKARKDGVRFINTHLHKVFPGRTLEAIKKHRQDAEYKRVLASLIEGETQNEVEGTVTEESVHLDGGEAVLDQATPLREVIEESIGHMQNPNEPTKYLLSIAQRILNGESSNGRLCGWLRKMFPHAQRPKGPSPRQGNAEPCGRRQARRMEYATLQKLYQKDKGAAARSILDEPNDCIMPSREDMVRFWRRIFSGQRSHERNQAPLRESELLKGLWNPIQEHEILAAELNYDSAAGPDGITVKNWRNVPTVKRKLMYNIILAEGKLESELNVARTVFLPKGRGELNPGQFRPLSITSVVVRQLHKILSMRMQKLHKFDERQKAFINCDGTIENLSILTTIIADAKMSKKEVHIATLDIKKAFDSVPHAVVIETIEMLGFPLPFVQYIKQLYETARTSLQYMGQETRIRVESGVLQGDPLSPLLFNGVMDRVLRQIDPDVGYRINGSLFNCIAYADDIILISSTKMGMQRILTQVHTSLLAFGMELSIEKSNVLSLVPSGREKKMKVVCDNSFHVGDANLRQIGVMDTWKYLGVYFEGKGLAKDRVCLSGDLSKLDRAPLKPQQRLELLKSAVLSKHLHTLVLGRTTLSKLRGLDSQVRKSLRKWLKLPNDVPLAYMYAAVRSGGLGIPCLAESIPMIKKSRLKRFLASGTTGAGAMGDSIYIQGQLDWCDKALAHIGEEVTKESRLSHWEGQLESKYDTMHLVRSRDCKTSTSWVHNKAYEISGRDYVRYNLIRAGCLPSRARTQRGRTGTRVCRAGCMASETNYHVIQQCHRTHGGRILRHDRLVKMIAECLGGSRQSYDVRTEPKFRTTTGLKKPDLLVTKNMCTYVLDVQVVSGTHMQEDNAAKIGKYQNVPGLREQVLQACGSNDVIFGAITLSYKGIFEKDTAELLYKLGINEQQMFMLSTSTLRGSWLNWDRFNKMNTVERTSPRRRSAN